MYAGPYEGSLERPFRVWPNGDRQLAFPSAMAFWPSMQFDPAEFRDELALHADLIARKAESFLFALRREGGDNAASAPGEWLDLALPDSVAMLAGTRSSVALRVRDRAALVHSLRSVGVRRRLVLHPAPGEFYVVAITARAISLHTLKLRSEQTAKGIWQHALVPDRFVAVEPFHVRARRVGRHTVSWASPPNAFLRVEVDRARTVFSHPDTEMDVLLELYDRELREDWDEYDLDVPVGHIASQRSSGDTVHVLPSDNCFFSDLLESYGTTFGHALRDPPEGWLPVIVRTEMHVGLRWYDLTPDRPRAMPPIVEARTLPWRRTRAVESPCGPRASPSS